MRTHMANTVEKNNRLGIEFRERAPVVPRNVMHNLNKKSVAVECVDQEQLKRT